jgi:hypothetical protein
MRYMDEKCIVNNMINEAKKWGEGCRLEWAARIAGQALFSESTCSSYRS